jgi:hypothetical protein
VKNSVKHPSHYRTLEDAHHDYAAFKRVRERLAEYRSHGSTEDLRGAASHVLWELESFLKLTHAEGLWAISSDDDQSTNEPDVSSASPTKMSA